MIAISSAQHWQGWQGFAPLLCSQFVFVVFVPTLAIWPELYLWPIFGWSACFVLLGLALYQGASALSADVAMVGDSSPNYRVTATSEPT